MADRIQVPRSSKRHPGEQRRYMEGNNLKKYCDKLLIHKEEGRTQFERANRLPNMA